MADSNASKTTKRRVKNPETFRERAVKATEQSAIPSRRSRVRSGAHKHVSSVLSPTTKFFKAILNFKLFRVFKKPAKFVGKILWPTYLRKSWHELRLVQWPDREETRKLTFAVLVFAVVFGGLVAIVDYGLDKIFRMILIN